MTLSMPVRALFCSIADVNGWIRDHRWKVHAEPLKEALFQAIHTGKTIVSGARGNLPGMPYYPAAWHEKWSQAWVRPNGETVTVELVRGRGSYAAFTRLSKRTAVRYRFVIPRGEIAAWAAAERLLGTPMEFDWPRVSTSEKAQFFVTQKEETTHV